MKLTRVKEALRAMIRRHNVVDAIALGACLLTIVIAVIYAYS